MPDTSDDELRQRIETAARAVPIRLGPNALAAAQRGEPIILNYGEVAELAAVLLPLLAPQLAAAPAPATNGPLLDRLTAALRAAAHDCGPGCPHESDDACSAAHPVQAGYTQHGIVQEIYGPPTALAAVLLPVAAAEHAAGRVDGLREAGVALQHVIDCARAYSPRRSNDRTTLQGAREIVLALIEPSAAISESRT